MLTSILVALLVLGVQGWGSGSGDSDMSIYSDSYNRDWLYDGSSISLQLDGCVMSYVTYGEDTAEDQGCMENESEDGTTYWYQMANCKRANVAYSLYSSSSSSKASCNSKFFQESFVTLVGLPEFIYLMATYDANNPFGNGNDDGGGGGDDFDYDEIPSCEESDNGYIGLGCASDGSFTLDYYYDQYCTISTGTYSSLSSLNSQLDQYRYCSAIYTSGDEYNAAQQLVAYSDSCSSLDASVCQDSASMSGRHGSNNILNHGGGGSKGYYKSWSTKAKYVMGGILLLAAFIMFTGILFTNRRRRRALLQRKFRQSRSSKSRKSSKSRSKSRDPKRSSSSRRSKSKSRRESSGGGGGGGGGNAAEESNKNGVLT